MRTTIPREKLVTIVESYNHLLDLHRQQKATQAQLLRWCVHMLRIDPRTYRMHGHETHVERMKQTSDNMHDQRLAVHYLEWLATQLEDAAGVVFDTSTLPATANEGAE